MTNPDTQVVDEELDDILSGFAMHASWWGFDKAMDTEGKHTSSTRTEALDAAKQALERWKGQQLVKELERIAVDDDGSGLLLGWTVDEKTNTAMLIPERIEQLKAQYNLNPKERSE